MSRQYKSSSKGITSSALMPTMLLSAVMLVTATLEAVMG